MKDDRLVIVVGVVVRRDNVLGTSVKENDDDG
jgi:hypothetical protein